MRPWISRGDEEKLKYAGLAQETGFALAYLHILLKLVNGTSKRVYLLEKSVIIMICSLFLIGQGGLLLVVF
jgi:hypothetical protein